MLREKIGTVRRGDLPGRPRLRYEPTNRDADQPRRSYTQLEYEIAVELGKPVFVFLATDDCPLDHPPSEPDELRRLQLEHLERIAAGDRIWMPFRSLADLTDRVRVMRFDPESLAEGSHAVAFLLTAELVDAGGRERRGEPAWVRDVVEPFQEILGRMCIRWNGTLQSESPSDTS